MAKLLSNISVQVNSASVRKEKRDGRDYIIVNAKTLPKDIVMNGILYPEDEVKKSYKTLEGTPAPYGHPKVNGKHVSATNPYGINAGWIGAFNENVVYENGRVSMDKVIDIQVANLSENGRKVLAALEKQEPIHTSTGVFVETEDLAEPVTNEAGKKYSRIARNMMFDHDCFLLNTPGAATPDEGVGIFVNSQDEVDVVNSDLPAEVMKSYDEEITWAAKRLADALQAKDNAAKSNGIIAKIMSLFSSGVKDEAAGLETNEGKKEGDHMPIKDEEFKALEVKVDTLVTNSENIAKSVADAVAAAVAPLNAAITELKANSANAEKAERSELVAKLVANSLIEEGDAEEFTTNALRKLAGKIKPGKAAPVVPGFSTNSADNNPFKDYNLNEEIDRAIAEGAKH